MTSCNFNRLYLRWSSVLNIIYLHLYYFSRRVLLNNACNVSITISNIPHNLYLNDLQFFSSNSELYQVGLLINLSACQAVIVGNIHGYKYGPFADEIEGRGWRGGSWRRNDFRQLQCKNGSVLQRKMNTLHQWKEFRPKDLWVGLWEGFWVGLWGGFLERSL